MALVILCSAVGLWHDVLAQKMPDGHWKTLSSGRPLWPGNGATYFTFALPNGSHAHLVVVDLHGGKWRLRPTVSEPTTAPTSTIVGSMPVSAAINGGYFNLKGSGNSTSYIVTSGKVVADPNTNSALLTNPALKPFLSRILNRSEVRFLRDAQGKQVVQVTRHTTAVHKGMTLIDSLQAGPQLLPAVTAVDEAFIRTNPNGTDADSISARKEAARTAFGVTADGHAMMLCVSGKGQDPESFGINLEELAALMRRLGCVQALNFDGGASTTMFVRFANGDAGSAQSLPSGEVVCGKQPETRVKSVLLLEPIAP